MQCPALVSAQRVFVNFINPLAAREVNTITVSISQSANGGSKSSSPE